MELIRQIEHRPMNDDQLSIYFIGQSGYVIKTRDCTLYIDPYLSDYIENSSGLNDPYMMRNYPPPFLPSKIKKIRCRSLYPRPCGSHGSMDNPKY